MLACLDCKKLYSIVGRSLRKLDNDESISLKSFVDKRVIEK